MNREQLKFIGRANCLAEEEFSASFAQDEGSQFTKELFREFQAEQGAKVDDWLRRRLPEVFATAGARPEWVERFPTWPFFEGRPMVFIGQMQMPDGEVTARSLSPGAVLYVFGARRSEPGGFRMEYRTTEQYLSLRALQEL